MPFEIRKTVFFVCPVCGEEYPLPEPPTQTATLKCIRESCNGRERFVIPSEGQKPGENPSAMLHEADLVSVSPSRTSETMGGERVKQRVSITVASAILINLALVMTIFVILYLVPMIVYRCSEEELPKEMGGVVRTDPDTENRFR